MEIRPFPPPEEGTAVIFTSETRAESSPRRRTRPEALGGCRREPAVEPAAAHRTGCDQRRLPDADAVAIEPEAQRRPPSGRRIQAGGNRFRSGRFPVRSRAGTRSRRVPARSRAAAPRTRPFCRSRNSFRAADRADRPGRPSRRKPAQPPKPTAAQPAPEPAPHDPLHALKAMSENERLAIFS